MARPSTARQRRRDLLPVLGSTFARIGYRRATTAELAVACGVPENTLFRLWGGKKRMYLAALDYLYERTVATWQGHLETSGAGTVAERLLDHEGEHFGEHGLYRVIFSGLSETDDPDIRKALRTMYGRFHAFVVEQLRTHRGVGRGAESDANDLLAWTVIGMATVAGVGRELRLISRQDQRRLFTDVGRRLLRS